MTEYEFRAVGRDGAEVRGREQAESEGLLVDALRKRQLALLDAKPLKPRAVGFALAVALVSELSPLLGSGIPLEQCLKIIAEDTTDVRLAALAEQVRQAIKRGEPLSEALARAGRFDSLLVALVRIGEASGELARVLGILETYYQNARQVRRDLAAALTYPAMLALVSVLSMIGLMVFVVPVFKDIFADSADIALPLGTRMLFALSDFAIAWGWIALLVAVLGVAALVILLRRHDAANRFWNALQLNIPISGELLGGFSGFKLAKALSIMLGAGTPLTQAVEISRPLLGNRLQREGLDRCLSALRKGEPLPQALARVPGLPAQFHRYVKLGNETGNLGSSLARVADILQEDFRARLRALIAVLDPLIIITMGGAIGFMVISILLAVFSLSDVR